MNAGPLAFNYRTPAELAKIESASNSEARDREKFIAERTQELTEAAMAPEQPCENCGWRTDKPGSLFQGGGSIVNPTWRYGGVGLCFPCTTGESDASDDYEVRL